jgi:hypothetical protein
VPDAFVTATRHQLSALTTVAPVPALEATLPLYKDNWLEFASALARIRNSQRITPLDVSVPMMPQKPVPLRLTSAAKVIVAE